ncbi:hypothetical protein [Rhizobium rhizogenes]|uniref:hypothetical protein n=1 Tax=Rhizobium rhizogenes TaxID=359 RepID=UPI0022BC273D|nr:hypothetical protein [Rhizobium rhizogenes]MCZ7463829.1 hypothetical protein [Rhizobium rhizogenes]
MKTRLLFSALLATALVAPQIAEARGGFGGRMPRMNFGGGGFHGGMGGGGFHPGGEFRGFNAPTHFQPRFHPAVAPHPAHGPRPAPRPAPHPAPHPAGGGNHPHPPTPHPGPGPHPPGPPPPPPPAPFWPGYWGGVAAWDAVTALAVGTVIATIPPSCTSVEVKGTSYDDCNGNWFVRRYNGHTVVYVAVADPR